MERQAGRHEGWSDFSQSCASMRHVFLFGEPLLACKDLDREQEAGVLLGADLKVI